jgi:HEAT repeat protein
MKDPDAEVRMVGTAGLCKSKDARAIELLLAAMEDSDAGVRATAIYGLRESKDMRAVDVLLAALKDNDVHMRTAAGVTLAKRGDVRAVDVLLVVLKDGSPNDRLAAVHALYTFKDDRVIVALIAALKDADSTVRTQAAIRLGSVKDSRAFDALLALMKNDASMREAAAIGLGGQRDARAVEPLAAVLEAKDISYEVRYHAGLALGSIGGPQAAGALSAAVTNQNVATRRAAIVGFGALGDKLSVQQLVHALKDPGEEVSLDAILALNAIRGQEGTRRKELDRLVAELNDEQIIQWLLTRLNGVQQNIREFAAWALPRIKDHRAVDGLLIALKDEHSARAAEVMGQSKNPLFVEPLIAALKDTNPGVRSAAAAGLGEIGDARAIQPLREAANDTASGVGKTALEALAKLGVKPQ